MPYTHDTTESSKRDVRTKRCTKCALEKSLSEFYRNSGSPDGHRPDCKACEKKPAATPRLRFWRHVVRGDADTCWEWRASRHTNNGYGRFWTGDRHVVAHRYAYELLVGPIPEGMEVCHKCDNPSCVNPAHLFLATHAANMRDAILKGRFVYVPHDTPRTYARGSQSPHAKLTEKDVRAIKKEYAQAGITQRELARKYGVSKATVGYILRGKTWRHVR